ncbi:MAG: hypothetical protein O7B99_04270, partial [Planctomycetota bacterium]|nr:hypothetical protein [Planctomycetota bacterium]
EARAMILSVLAEEEARREEEREARRAERELDQLTRRAERIATELGLSQKDQGQLLEVLIMENEQRDAFFQDMRDAGGFGNETRNVMREELAAIREWKNGELSQRLGAQAAQQIAEMDQPRFGRDRGDRGGTDRRNRGGGGF